jgi:hypothetical protein
MMLLMLLLAGLFFAAWPHFMREAGLSSATALLMYGGAAFVAGVAWVAVSRGWHELHGSALNFGLAAGCLNALGFVAFAYVFTRHSRAQLGKDVLIVLVIQVALNAAWAGYQAGGVSWRLAAGTATALVTIFLLS